MAFSNGVQTEFEDTGVDKILGASVSWIWCMSEILEDTCWESRFLGHTYGDSNWVGWDRTQVGKGTWIRWFSSVQLLSHIRLFVTPWTAAHQASLSITNSQSLLKLMSIELVMPSNHLILVVPFSSCLQSFLASGSFQMGQFFASGGQSIGVSASALVIPMNIQDWFPLGWTDLISLQSKGLSSLL